MGRTGLIIVSGPSSSVRDQLIPLEFDGSLAGTSLPVVSVSDMLLLRGCSRQERISKPFRSQLDDGSRRWDFLPRESSSAEIDIRAGAAHWPQCARPPAAGDEPAHEIIVVGAHIDHLGEGTAQFFTGARRRSATQIHFGADDNASGVAAMLRDRRVARDGEGTRRTDGAAATSCLPPGRAKRMDCSDRRTS